MSVVVGVAVALARYGGSVRKPLQLCTAMAARAPIFETCGALVVENVIRDRGFFPRISHFRYISITGASNAGKEDHRHRLVVAEQTRFFGSLEANKSLRLLNLTNNGIGVAGAFCIAALLELPRPTLERVIVDENRIGTEGAAAIANALRSNTSLESLSLRNNEIGSQGAAALSDALQHNSTLRRLDLSCNLIRNTGVIKIAKALSKNSTLKSLDVHDNEIDDGGGRALAEMLSVNNNLEYLALGDNFVGAAATKAIALSIAGNRSLRILSLYDNPIGPDGAFALAAALVSNIVLRELDVRQCFIGDSGVRAVWSSLLNAPFPPDMTWQQDRLAALIGHGLVTASFRHRCVDLSIVQKIRVTAERAAIDRKVSLSIDSKYLDALDHEKLERAVCHSFHPLYEKTVQLGQTVN